MHACTPCHWWPEELLIVGQSDKITAPWTLHDQWQRADCTSCQLMLCNCAHFKLAPICKGECMTFELLSGPDIAFELWQIVESLSINPNITFQGKYFSNLCILSWPSRRVHKQIRKILSRDLYSLFLLLFMFFFCDKDKSVGLPNLNLKPHMPALSSFQTWNVTFPLKWKCNSTCTLWQMLNNPTVVVCATLWFESNVFFAVGQLTRNINESIT